MLLNVIGVEHKQGVFSDDKGKEISYNNIYVYAIGPNTNKNKDGFAFGKIPTTVKIKNDVDIVSAIFGTVPTLDDLQAMIGQDFDFYFNQKGNIDRIVPYEPPAVKKGA